MAKTFIARELGVYPKELGMGVEPIEFLFPEREPLLRERALLWFSWFSIFYFSVSIYVTIAKLGIDRYKRNVLCYAWGFRVHKELLSDKERQMLKRFLETGEKDKHFRILKNRIKKGYPIISQDYQLISQAINKLDSSKAT
jgi:hypothetical protein